ncbi:hypothetical protein [Corallococcus llansteffanensis]|uniref:Lipoprotein n=1 Tax=Corallococcus llansteffanensis TaxID=2316731 RepID=A0A3A8PEE6_9BACT|nr:hypothetical protein [Corallococcus llansteffanensis]RKH50872.1 hypothetical protein D7V93_29990 [Corallococcus llansteffanensis]
MRELLLRGVGLTALLIMAGCGGPVDESTEPELGSQEQELPMCKVDVPKPCPTGYVCIGRTCYPNVEP